MISDITTRLTESWSNEATGVDFDDSSSGSDRRRTGRETTLPTRPGASREQRYDTVLRETLAWARERDYCGWDYADGGSSKLLQWLPVDSKWINIGVQELAKRPPVNLRPLLLVEQRRNYKGTALFTMANQNAARLGLGASGRDSVDYSAQARQLADWLLENRCVGYSGFCGSHKHPIQLLDGQSDPNDPDIVSTSYAVKALLAAADLDAEYADTAETAADFVETDLDYREVPAGAKVDYHMHESGDCYTINSAALGARLFTDLYAYTGVEEYRRKARQILDHVATRQASIGGWYYRDPPEGSHLSMDTHHNCFIVETFLRYRDACDADRYDDVIDRAMAFVRERLFEPTGAPNWDESDAYPKDIHAAANGILLFTYAGDLAFARRILDWVLENLYAGDGRFYYRKRRLYTDRVTLMRWCQAWMAFAISEYRSAAEDGVARVDERISSREEPLPSIADQNAVPERSAGALDLD